MVVVSNRGESAKAEDTAKETMDKAKDLADRGRETAAKAGERIAATAERTTEEGHATAARMVDHNMAEMGKGTAAVTDFARRAGETVGRASAQTAKAESDLVGYWLSLARDQVQHNMDTWRRVLAIRDVRELIEVQSDFYCVSLNRLAEGLSRQVDLAGHLLQIEKRAS